MRTLTSDQLHRLAKSSANVKRDLFNDGLAKLRPVTEIESLDATEENLIRYRSLLDLAAMFLACAVVPERDIRATEKSKDEILRRLEIVSAAYIDEIAGSNASPLSC